MWSCSTSACPTSPGWRSTSRSASIDARIPVIFVTMAKAADAAIEAMKQGAYDYLFKPLDLHQLRRVVGEALEVARRMREPAVVAETAPDADVDGAIVGCCPAMREVYKAIGRVAAQDVAGADHRRERHRQGAGRPRHLPARPAGQGAVPGPQLRRHPGEPAGERAVRPREGGLHRRRPRAASASSSSATAARSSSTRSATCRWPRRPRCCACCRSRRSSGSAATRRSGPTCG